MGFKFFALLTFVLTHAITAAPAEERNQTNEENSQLEKLFVRSPAWMEIVKYLSNDDLKDLNEIPVVSECANFMLNCRSKILHYQNGKINPPYLEKAYELVHQTKFINPLQRGNFVDHNWSPCANILFGGEKPLNIAGGPFLSDVLILTSQEDHLNIFYNRVIGGGTGVFIPNEMMESGRPMNGFVIPWLRSPNIVYQFDEMRNILWSDNSKVLAAKFKDNELPLKLAIVINSDGENHEVSRNRTINIAEIIRKNSDNASICVVAQPNARNVEYLYGKKDNVVLTFYGTNTRASTLVVDKEDTKETLKSKLENWKEKLFFLDDHQTIAFHFTINGTEPVNSEELFSETFPGIPLSTLCLLDQSSTVGVNTEIGFHDGPVYVILGFRKFESENTIKENHTKRKARETEPSISEGVKRLKL